MTSRRHLLVVAASAELYGSDRTLLHSMPALTEAFRVTVAVPIAGPAIDILEGAGARVITIPDLGLRRRNLHPAHLGPWLGRSVKALRVLRRLHRQDPVALVYCNTLAVAVADALRPLLRVPLLTHVHECPVEPSWFPRLLLRPVAAASDLLVCNSQYTLDLAARYAPRFATRAKVIHNGVDIPPRPARLEPSTSLRIGCVGRIHPKKGQWVLIEAARIAVAEGSDWELHFYGDALPEHRALERQIHRQVEDSGLDGRVHWHGFVADTGALYETTDVSVVPSVVPEEFSLVCAEAQVRERAVVATGPGGPAEVIADGETGLIVPPQDAPALARALQRLERDRRLREEMGRRGRERMVAHFSVERYAESIRDTCVDLADSRRR